MRNELGGNSGSTMSLMIGNNNFKKSGLSFVSNPHLYILPPGYTPPTKQNYPNCVRVQLKTLDVKKVKLTKNSFEVTCLKNGPLLFVWPGLQF